MIERGVLEPGHRAGFTLLEIVVVLVIAGILLGITLPRIGDWRAIYAAENAKSAFVLFATRARAESLERGRTVCLGVHPATREAAMVVPATDDTVEVLDYTGEAFHADITTSSGMALEVCYTPRGFALPSLGTQDVFPDTVTFTVQGHTAEALVNAIGSVEPL